VVAVALYESQVVEVARPPQLQPQPRSPMPAASERGEPCIDALPRLPGVVLQVSMAAAAMEAAAAIPETARGLCSGSGTSGLLKSGQNLINVASVMYCVVHGSCSGPRVVQHCLVGACQALRVATSTGHCASRSRASCQGLSLSNRKKNHMGSQQMSLLFLEAKLNNGILFVWEKNFC
jgi:hypothetical protein